MTEIITSSHNPAIQRVRELLAQRKKREQEQAFVVEGVRLAEEALAAGFAPNLALFSSEISERGRQVIAGLDSRQTQIEEVEPRLLDRTSDTRTSQGLLIVFQKPGEPPITRREPLLVLDNIRDPGNLGTILRSACALGFQTVFLTPGSVDPYSPKVLRAGMGAQFKLTVVYKTASEINQFCHQAGVEPLQIVLADSQAHETCWETDLTQPLCLIIGGEAFGAEPEIQAIVDKPILIPMEANNESLNAAMAASILMYEVFRQRKNK